jgi:hypothetical protein
MSAPAAPSGDGYLDSVSDESVQVLNHFGGEAPALLNRYACTVEDALLGQAQQTSQALEQLQQLSAGFQELETYLGAALEDNQAYELLTTDSELLADYVNDFFGPDGVDPQILPEDRLAAEVAAGGYHNMPQPGFIESQGAYERPQFDMPSPGAQQGAGGDFWGAFRQTMTSRPQDAWKVLSMAPPGALQSRPLVSEYPF